MTKPNDFLSIKDFTPRQIRRFLHLASAIKLQPQAYAEALKGKTLALIFEKPSLRTRVTFDVGIHQLGGFSLYLSPAEINLGKRESVYDVAKNLERMVQGIMIRTFAHEIMAKMAEYASIPVINGLTDYSHPCQAMADFLTIFEVKSRLRGVKVAFIGDGNNVAHSLMFAGAQVGAHVWVATPPGYEPNADAVRWAEKRALETSGSCTVQRCRCRRYRRRRHLHRRLGQHGAGSGNGKAPPGISPVPGQRQVVRPCPARRNLHALPPRPPRRRGHR